MSELIPIISVLAVFGSFTAVCVMPGYFKARSQREMQKTIRAAIAQGQAFPAELVDVLTRDVRKGLPTRSRDLRRAILFIAAAAGLALLGQFSNLKINATDGHVLQNGMLGVACVPLMFGLAYLAIAAINKDKE